MEIPSPHFSTLARVRSHTHPYTGTPMADTKIQRAIERLAQAKYRLADTSASLAALESTLVQDAGGQNQILLDYCARLRAVKGEIHSIEGDLDSLSAVLAA